MANWFADMCANYGLVPAKPKTARNIKLNDVMFTVTGEPRFITRIEQYPTRIRVHSSDGWVQSFDNDQTISFIARRS